MRPSTYLTTFSLILLLAHCQGLGLQHQMMGERDAVDQKEAPAAEAVAFDLALDGADPKALELLVTYISFGQLYQLLSLSAEDEPPGQTALTLLAQRPELLQQRDAQGRTLLHEAARAGHEWLLQFLHTFAPHLTSRTPFEQAVLERLAWIERHTEAHLHFSLDMAVINVGGQPSTANASEENPAPALAGYGIDEPDAQGNTALHEAAQAGHWEVVELLLTQGAGINARNERHETPLHLAVQQQHTETVSHLLGHAELELNVPDVDHHTPLYYAQTTGSAELIQALTKHNAQQSVDDLTLEAALKAAPPNIPLISQLMDDNPRSLRDRVPTNRGGLQEAVREGSLLNTVRHLLNNRNMDINRPGNQETYEGRTLLHEAVQAGHAELAHLLLLRGAGSSTNQGDRFGWTPLHWAVWCQAPTLLKLLLDHLPDPPAELTEEEEQAYRNPASTARYQPEGAEQSYGEGVTPLSLAAAMEDFPLISLLMEKGAKLPSKGNISLHLAAQEGDLEQIVALLTHPNTDVKALGTVTYTEFFSRNLHTPLYYALANGHWAAANLLREAGAALSQAQNEAQGKRLIERFREVIAAADISPINYLLNAGITLGDADTKLTIHEAAMRGNLKSLVIHFC